MINTVINKIKYLFYTSVLGNLYFKYLLWSDRRKDRKRLRYLTPKEIQSVLREYSLIGEGVKEIKDKINSLVESKTPQEYNQVLQEIEDLAVLATRDIKDPKAQFANLLRSKMDLSNVQIKNDTDFAKMIDSRIKDMYNLQEYRAKRQLLRDYKKAKLEGNLELAAKLKSELEEKHNVRRTN
jgi:hypothetical protein